MERTEDMSFKDLTKKTDAMQKSAPAEASKQTPKTAASNAGDKEPVANPKKS
jgi:hypothetical protein